MTEMGAELKVGQQPERPLRRSVPLLGIRWHGSSAAVSQMTADATYTWRNQSTWQQGVDPQPSVCGTRTPLARTHVDPYGHLCPDMRTRITALA